MAKRRSSTGELKIVFDTSALYTGSEKDLVRKEVASLIGEHKSHSDMAVTWHIPDVVKHERLFQMQRKALEILPSIQRVEKLLGHDLNITEDILKKRVGETVEEQIRDFGWRILELDVTKIDWNRLILESCYRKPPFEDSDKTEKGFRDSLIIESFLQLVEDSPKTASLCRLVLVTSDGLLKAASQSRIVGLSNTKIVDSVEALKDFINTLVSEVTEEFVQGHRKSAGVYFFNRDTKSGLYYTETVRDTISNKFKKELQILPKGATERENSSWFIYEPQFVKKVRQRVFWTTRVEVEAEAYDWSISSISFGQEPTSFSSPTISFTGSDPVISSDSPYITVGSSGPIYSSSGGTVFAPSSKRVKVGSGKTVFEILWSALLKTTGAFTRGKIESIKYVDTIWS